MTLTNSGLTVGAEGDDTLSSIESAVLTGTSGADTIDASAFSNGDVVLVTGGGGDTLKGGTGDDEYWLDVTGLTSSTSSPPISIENGAGGDDEAVVVNAGVISNAGLSGWFSVTAPIGLTVTIDDSVAEKSSNSVTLDGDITLDGATYNKFKIAAEEIDTNGYDITVVGSAAVDIVLEAETKRLPSGATKSDFSGPRKVIISDEFRHPAPLPISTRLRRAT